MNMRRISAIWSQAPWRRKKEDTQSKKGAMRRSQSVHETTLHPYTLQSVEEEPVNVTAQDHERRTRTISRIFALDAIVDLQDAAPKRTTSVKNKRRSLFRPNEQAEEFGRHDVEQATNEESFLKRMRRKSQNFTLPRPSTSSGVSRRRSFFGGNPNDDADQPPMPTSFDQFQQRRPLSRHVPITIDHLQGHSTQEAETGPGMAITSNEVQDRSHSFSEYSKPRPMSTSSSFSHLRPWNQRTVRSASPMIEESESDSEDDILTALPDIDFKEMASLELKQPASYIPASYDPTPFAAVDRQSIQRVSPKVVEVDRHSLQRATPKVVDIVAPRPMSMFAAPPRRPATAATTFAPTAREAKRRSLISNAPSTAIGALEDGPQGDWSRTRHSWLGIGDEGGKEQVEWDKLKQFIEAFGTGQDGAVVSMVRQMDDSGDSSNSSETSAFHGNKFANAQALAALEFGLN